MIRPFLLSTAAAALLASCVGIGDTGEQAAIRQQLIGQGQSQILSCAGVPDRSRVEGAVEYMTYENAMMAADRAAGFGLSSGIGIGSGVGTGVGLGAGFGTPIGETAVRSNYCEVTFTIAGGRVADVAFNSAGGFNRFDQCRAMVASCLAN